MLADKNILPKPGFRARELFAMKYMLIRKRLVRLFNTKEKTMETVMPVLQILIAFTIFNVWLLRYGKSTDWRGGEAKNMKEEFKVYGLPLWSVGVVGFLKVLFAVLLIAGIWYPVLIAPAALGIAVLMAGAMIMHFKVEDPIKKSIPSFTLLSLSLIVALF